MDTIIFVSTDESHNESLYQPDDFRIEKYEMNEYYLIKLILPGGLFSTIDYERAMSTLKICEIQRALEILSGYSPEIYCVYSEKIRDKLMKTDWIRNWHIPEFNDYHEKKWAEEVLNRQEEGIEGDIIIIRCPRTKARGYFHDYLLRRAPYIKSIRWILKSCDIDDELLYLFEDLEYDYGLTVEQEIINWDERIPVELVNSKYHNGHENTWKKTPLTVIDFSGDDRLTPYRLPEQSKWIDISASNYKKIKIKQHFGKIKYVSLKDLWSEYSEDNDCRGLIM